MESIITQLIAEWGTFGLVLFGIGYLVWDNIKIARNKKDNSEKVVTEIKGLSDKIDNISERVDLIDVKVDEFKNQLDTKIELVEDRIDSVPQNHINTLNELNNKKISTHLKQINDLMKLGPKLHRIIQDANDRIGSDHIFIGSFHNGTSSLSGIPYCKFDIIAERFSPAKVCYDCEFAHMYKDSDILRFDVLPSLLVQEGMLHFHVPADGDIELSQYDDIIWRRMRGRKIRQIALRLTRDSNGTPSGFVGVVKYDHGELHLKYLDECGAMLEEIYKEAELKEN